MTSKLEMPWLELKAKLKQRYGHLTDDDLAFIEGKGEELWLRLERKLGLSRIEAERMVSELEAEGREGHAAQEVRGFTDLARERAGEAVEAARKRTRIGMEKMRAGAERGRERVTNWEHEFEDYVREHPAPSLFWALVAGFMIGRAARR